MSKSVEAKSGHMRPTKKALAGGGAALLLLGTMTAAQAAVPDANGVISACYMSQRWQRPPY